MTAIRETFEETGILLASPKDASKTPSPSDLAQGRRAIHSRTDPTTFPSFLAAHGLTAETSIDKLIPFSQWVTPVGSKSRFWTWFYVGFLQEMKGVLAAEDASVSNLSGVLSPTHDNHIEIQSAYFQQPRAIIDSFDKGDISFMPPQFYLLTMLTDIIDLHARERHSGNANSTAGYVREVAGRQFGGRVFNPRFGGKYTGDDGVERSILMYEGDGMYDGKDGDKRVKHRSLLTFKDGRPSSIEIQRDIDLLGLDSSDKSSGPSAKL
ncbi:hypothetical protein M408DRAFT_135507 [Serendipita vermifera MAFF 305830]|uniref:Nudix hydrolase domain-containing protein n=1 Tax=Serendipita vermifera MAFF 305830 TaxID=933852 RepID=A0A0C3AKC8_SERVB|nr:hypothetical protein M408DRAFT_135507 [Serendipita vermifera MAFF 305830]